MVGFFQVDPAEVASLMVECIQVGFTAVVDGPQDAGLALRAGEAAGLVDPSVLEAPGDLELQRCRLLRTGAAGKQQ